VLLANQLVQGSRAHANRQRRTRPVDLGGAPIVLIIGQGIEQIAHPLSLPILW